MKFRIQPFSDQGLFSEYIGDSSRFKCFFVFDLLRLIYIDEKAIIQEDLSVRGYKIKDCKKRLNLKECKMVLDKVAKYHACTAVLYTKVGCVKAC